MEVYILIVKMYCGMGYSHPVASLVTTDKAEAEAEVERIAEIWGESVIIDLQSRTLGESVSFQALANTPTLAQIAEEVEA